MVYWRVTSQTVYNIVKALDAGVWGENRAATLTPFADGDRLAFYCSGRRGGFVATGTAAGPMFVGSGLIWMDGIYPYRIPISADGPPLETPVDPGSVLERLGQTRFQHAAPRKAVIPLTRQEFDAIERLIRDSAS